MCERDGARELSARAPELSLRVPHRTGSDERPRSDTRRKAGPGQDPFIPSEALGCMPTDDPEVEQAPRDVGRFGETVTFEEPRQGGPVALEIFTHSVQPCDLVTPNQPLGGQGGFVGAIPDQPLKGVVALARSRELASGVYAHGIEHVVQRTRRHSQGFGPQKQALLYQTRRRPERVVVPGRRTLTTGQRGRGRVDRKEAWQGAKMAEGALLVRVQQVITPGDGRIHRLLTFGKIA